MAKSFKSLSLEEIQTLNASVINSFGGRYNFDNGNFHNRESLEYILEAVLFPVFGQDRYPTHIDKIAAISHTVICRHVFLDGNKRTAMAILTTMLEANGHCLNPTKEVEDYIVRIATENIPVEDVAAWLRQKVRPLYQRI